MRRYGPYKNQHGHLFWIDEDDDGQRHTVSVHREVMEKHLGRTLCPDEIVHHKNRVRDDNRIDNLEVLDPLTHEQLHRAIRGEGEHELVCVLCGRTFSRMLGRERHNRKQGKAGPFCGRSCAGRWSRAQQLAAVVK